VRRLALALALVPTLALTWLASSGGHAAAADPDLVVLYLSGWQSELNNPAEFLDHDWRNVDDAVQKSLPGRILSLPYSYTYKPASYTSPPPYTKKDTNQSLDASADALGNQLQDLGARYPRARFLLVGHSEGGAVATYWAGKAKPGAARVVGIVTFDSPVEGVAWADVYRALLLARVVRGDAAGAAGLAVLRGLFDFALGDNGPLIDQLDRGKTPSVFTTMENAVSNMSAAGGKVYNGYDCGDLFITCGRAYLPGAEAHDFNLKFLADCRAEAVQRDAAHVVGAAGLSPDWSESSTAGSSAKLDPTKTRTCYTTMHHRVIEVPEAGTWVAGIAKAVIESGLPTPTSRASQSPAVSYSPTPTSTRTPAVDSELDKINSGIRTAIGGNLVQAFPCPTADWCARALSSVPGSAQSGLVSTLAGRGSNPAGTGIVMGRTSTGNWEFYFEDPIVGPLRPSSVPGKGLVCAGTGGTLNIRSEPSTDSRVAGAIRDGQIVDVSEFVLSRAGHFRVAGQLVGQGWYRVSTPASGWISSDFVFDVDHQAGNPHGIFTCADWARRQNESGD
jgi:pimeloyl-ACP methyl ester carboxylesterase